MTETHPPQARRLADLYRVRELLEKRMSSLRDEQEAIEMKIAKELEGDRK